MKNHQNKKIHVVVLFGGRSAEHEVSIQSARNVVHALDTDKYDITLIGIDKNGTWLPFSVPQLFATKRILLSEQKVASGAKIVSYTNRGEFLAKNGNSTRKIEVVFPVLHGPFGEDGTIQGLLKPC